MPDLARKYVVPLSGGGNAEVSERQYYAIQALHRAIEDMAEGVTRNIAIVEQDYRGVPRRLFVSVDTDVPGMNKFADQVTEQGKRVRDYASSWEGNAPAPARSYAEH